MNKIVVGDKVHWKDPDEGISSGTYQVTKINGEIFTLGSIPTCEAVCIEAMEHELTYLGKVERTIQLPCYGITITLNGTGSGNISSDLHEPDKDENGWLPDHEDIYLFNRSMDALESMILAHACAGVDVEDPKYLEGIETAVQSIGQQNS